MSAGSHIPIYICLLHMYTWAFHIRFKLNLSKIELIISLHLLFHLCSISHSGCHLPSWHLMWEHESFHVFPMSSQYPHIRPVSQITFLIICSRHSLLSKPITAVLFQAFTSFQLAYLGLFLSFLFLCFFLLITASCSNFAIEPLNCGHYNHF